MDWEWVWTVPCPQFMTDSSCATTVYEGAIISTLLIVKDFQKRRKTVAKPEFLQRHQLCLFLPQYADMFKSFFDLQDENLK